MMRDMAEKSVGWGAFGREGGEKRKENFQKRLIFFF